MCVYATIKGYLQESINCIKEWKDCYKIKVEIVEQYPWDGTAIKFFSREDYNLAKLCYLPKELNMGQY